MESDPLHSALREKKYENSLMSNGVAFVKIFSNLLKGVRGSPFDSYCIQSILISIIISIIFTIIPFYRLLATKQLTILKD